MLLNRSDIFSSTVNYTPIAGTKPSLVEVVSSYVALRRVGRQWRGLCPFHSETTPSFYVHEEKGFHCFGCHEGGDVIAFIQRIEGVSFRQACTLLGIEGGNYRPKPIDTHKRRAAALLTGWMNEQHLRVGALLREVSRKICIANQIPDAELAESLSREWEILSDLHADLQRPEVAEELLKAKGSIEAITAMAPVEPLPKFPEYAEILRAHLPGVAAVC